jgi:hypothetical protein
MTVKQLIEQLQQLDPDLHVFTQGYEGGYHYAGVNPPKDIALNVHDEWYYGPHEDADTQYYIPDKSKYTIVKGVVL